MQESRNVCGSPIFRIARAREDCKRENSAILDLFDPSSILPKFVGKMSPAKLQSVLFAWNPGIQAPQQPMRVESKNTSSSVF